jgi:hypothetical protein
MLSHLKTSAILLMLTMAISGRATTALAQSVGSSATNAPPVEIIKVYRDTNYLSANEYKVTLGVSFENVSEKVAVAVKWYVHFEDAFDKVLDTETVSSYGRFAPNVVIDPTGLWKGKVLASSAGSAGPVSYGHAWAMENTYGSAVSRFVFEVAAVRFEDGTVWTNPAAQEFP